MDSLFLSLSRVRLLLSLLLFIIVPGVSVETWKYNGDIYEINYAFFYKQFIASIQLFRKHEDENDNDYTYRM